MLQSLVWVLRTKNVYMEIPSFPDQRMVIEPLTNTLMVWQLCQDFSSIVMQQSLICMQVIVGPKTTKQKTKHQNNYRKLKTTFSNKWPRLPVDTNSSDSFWAIPIENSEWSTEFDM